MASTSAEQLKKELQELEASLQQRSSKLDEQRQSARSLHSSVVETTKSVETAEASKSDVQKEFTSAARTKTVLESEQKKAKVQGAPDLTRDEYVSHLVDEEERRKEVEEEIQSLSARIKELKERNPDAQKRLTIVRLMSLLDDLQESLNKKVSGPAEDDEPRAQELLKTLQELTRERERTLMFLTKKEREMSETVNLKRRRVIELRTESDRHVSVLAETNDYELLGITERIQQERRDLLREIDRIRDLNARMSEIIRDTKFSVDGNRDAALSADDTRGTSDDPEAESKELREKIIAARNEQRRLVQKSAELKERIDEDTETYTSKMSQIKKELILYQNESARIETENKELKALCDTLAISLQQNE